MTDPPLLVVFPANDQDFRGWAERLVAGSNGRPDRLERSLRGRYPDAVVRPRDLSGDVMAIWYIYRDGSWRPE